MRTTRLPFVFILLFGLCHSSPDDNLPVYLRGIGWDKVEEYQKQDLRLSNDVVPTNYFIELDVNIRGHAGAEKSDFNGTVTIYLEFKQPSDKIELHSRGLVIDKVTFIEHEILSEPAGISSYSNDSERETITVHLNRTVHPHERFMLQIAYQGVAKLDEYGLYENWNPRLNKTLDSFGPYVIASKNFPTGARFWFPCFDEPDKRATFELQVNHPSDTNAYTNADVERIESVGDNRRTTVFEKTQPLSTYQVALSINPYPRQDLVLEGLRKVRLITSTKSFDHNAAANFDPVELARQLENPFRPIVPFILKNNLQLLGPIAGMHDEKLDIIILEGAYSLTIQPGLITIGRRNLIQTVSSKLVSQELKHLSQVGLGNIAMQSSSESWLRDMFSYSLPNHTFAQMINPSRRSSISRRDDLPQEEIFDSSLHERPLRDSLTYATTTKQYLASKNQQHAFKASHLIELIERFCGVTKEDMYRKFISTQGGELFHVDLFIDIASKDCSDPAVARMILQDFIDQPGKAFLTVKRANNSVTIKQTRYHNTFFYPELRDNRHQTRFTIPIYYTIDDQPGMKVFNKNDSSLTISVGASSLFLIDYHYEHLYLVYYEDTQIPPKNSTDRTMYNAMLRSLVAATSMGFVKYDRIQDQHVYYQEQGLFEELYEDSLIEGFAEFFISRLLESAYHEDRTYREERCKRREERTWDGTFNNETLYWDDIQDTRMLDLWLVACLEEWDNASTYSRLIEDNFVGANARVQPERVGLLVGREVGDSWRDLHRLFFRHAANRTDHRFDMLAEEVLVQSRVPEPFRYNDYPNLNIREDYLKELREFVIRNPRKAASMSTQIAMKLEREFVREELTKYHTHVHRILWWDRNQKKKQQNRTKNGSDIEKDSVEE